MSAFLFLWNPLKDNSSFKDYARVLSDAIAGRPYQTPWICPSRQPQPGDIAFLQRTGKSHNGIFARGSVIRAAHNQRDTQVVTLLLDSFLPIGGEISRAAILTKAEYDRPWSPMASGNVIPSPILKSIEDLWASRYKSSAQTVIDLPFDEDVFVALEGEAKERLIRHRSREASLRAAKIADTLKRYSRLACEVPGCGFDFSQTYGAVGKGYAHVHHLKPLSSRDGPQLTRLTDLAIVCANCHAMIHRDGECRDPSSLMPK